MELGMLCKQITEVVKGLLVCIYNTMRTLSNVRRFSFGRQEGLGPDLTHLDARESVFDHTPHRADNLNRCCRSTVTGGSGTQTAQKCLPRSKRIVDSPCQSNQPSSSFHCRITGVT